MTVLNKRRCLCLWVTVALCVLSSHYNFAQNADTTKSPSQFSGSATITNNGISIIPTFSLGKPAGVIELAMGKKFTFEPQFRFSLEGKPWSIVLWGRYKLLKTDRFNLNIGAHPALIFKTITNTVNGVDKEIIISQRYFATEISPNYILRKNVSVGVYYLYSKGMKESYSKNTHFITLNSNFSNIKLTEDYFLKFNPQVYYLNIDGKDGVYFSSGFTLANKKYPISLQSFINKTIKTDLTSKDFVMNVSLIYSFNKNYLPVK